ncbi:MAG: transporter substrate-binding domain-containing protein [Betaproteobacteria bacterium]
MTMKTRIVASLLTLVGLFVFGNVDVQAQGTIDKIKQRGKLIVGVKPDYKPWGFLETSGKIVGFEIDLANDIAKRLGTPIELVPVSGANRMEFLNQGRIDMILATMGDNADRRKIVGMIQPNYYAGATNVLARKSAKLKKWTDLKGEKVCATQGAYFNKRVTELYAPSLVVFPALPEAMNALNNGNCVAFLFDDTLIMSTLSAGDPKWADYEMPLISEDPQPWAIGVRLDDLDSPFGKLIQDASLDWHKKGTLQALEQKWQMKPSPFLKEMHDKYK